MDADRFKTLENYFLKKLFFPNSKLLNLLQYFFYFMFWFFGHGACGILAPLPGIEPTLSCTGGWGLNPWIAREVRLWFLNSFSYYSQYNLISKDTLFYVVYCFLHTNISPQIKCRLLEGWPMTYSSADPTVLRAENGVTSKKLLAD